jgi:hypothetical protein
MAEQVEATALEHVHTWAFGGLRYEDGQSPLPGTGACPRLYFDWFYCSGCLANRYANQRAIGNTYSAPLSGALPR